MFIVVQSIRVQWTKQSRGGTRATRRNTVPVALPLPVMDLRDIDHPIILIQHDLHYDEPDFAISHQSFDVGQMAFNTRHELRCVDVWAQRAHLRVRYQYGRYCAGAPERSASPKTLDLGLGDWGRVIFNERFGWASGWSYHQQVHNIALVSELDADLFLSEPPHLMTDLADLR